MKLPEPMPLHLIENGAVNVPVVHCADSTEVHISPELGGVRYSVKLEDEAEIQTLLVNRGSDVLVVVFHGMMVPGHHHLPRFEWLRTLQETDYSCLFISDPTLSLDEEVRLAWYLGREDWNLYDRLASLVQQVFGGLAAEKIVLAGSSGGGYAALQVGSHLPGSVAVPFNPQTDVSRYHWDMQVAFAKRIMPHLLSDDPAMRRRWADSLGVKASAVDAYRGRTGNYVLYVQNRNDKHHYDEHYLPFVGAVEDSPNADRCIFELYDGPAHHEPPGRGRFRAGISRAVDAAPRIGGLRPS